MYRSSILTMAPTLMIGVWCTQFTSSRLSSSNTDPSRSSAALWEGSFKFIQKRIRKTVYKCFVSKDNIARSYHFFFYIDVFCLMRATNWRHYFAAEKQQHLSNTNVDGETFRSVLFRRRQDQEYNPKQAWKSVIEMDVNILNKPSLLESEG